MRFKRVISVILCFLTVISNYSALNVNAITEGYYTSSDGKWELLFLKKECMLVDYFGSEGTVELPKSIDGYIPNSIDLSENKKIVNVTIPQNYVYFDNSFVDCPNLKTVIFSRNYSDGEIKLFGNFMFQDCKKLTKAVLPNLIGPDAFGNYNRLPGSTFLNCKKLTEVVLPDNLKGIGTSAFDGCSSLKRIEVPEGVTTIEQGVFDGCTSLKYLKLPSTLETLKDRSIVHLKDCTVEAGENNETVKAFFEEETNDPSVTVESTLTLIPEPTTNPDDPEKERVKGDVNGDGKFNILDVTILQKYLCGMLSYEPLNTDFNGDGDTDINDATAMQRALSKLKK